MYNRKLSISIIAFLLVTVVIPALSTTLIIEQPEEV